MFIFALGENESQSEEKRYKTLTINNKHLPQVNALCLEPGWIFC
jgi:hypothetical protein